MVERVGLAAESAKAMSQVAPRLLILAGATGVGKSTAAREIAAASGFSRILSTDAIREIMRTCIDVDEDPALHRSSFSRGENGEPVIDWQRTCESVEPGITATIERARREGIDLLIEGVHIVPSDRLLTSMARRRWHCCWFVDAGRNRREASRDAQISRCAFLSSSRSIPCRL